MLQFGQKKNTQITVPPGCRVRLSQHTIKVSASVIGPRIPWTFNSQWDTMEVLRRFLSRVLRRRTKCAPPTTPRIKVWNPISSVWWTMLLPPVVCCINKFYHRLHHGNSCTWTGLIILGGILSGMVLFGFITMCCYHIRRSPPPRFTDTNSMRMSFLGSVPSCGILNSKNWLDLFFLYIISNNFQCIFIYVILMLFIISCILVFKK